MMTDRTMLAKFGFQDTDRKSEPHQKAALALLCNPQNIAAKVLASSDKLLSTIR